ncbi:MAG: cupin domain-containing protein [Betaproteobacteria bacterium]|nr:cupin domain-containing protein [Betaproteobacteria bacterium]
MPRPTPVLPDSLLLALLDGLKPIAPRRDLRQAVRDAVARDAARGAFITTVPMSGDGWTELIPKVHAKMVHTDGVAQSWLVRLEPGARAPAHDHPAPEECIVLEGSVRYLGGSTLNAGDYEVVQPGHHHTELVSDHGALVFLRYQLPLDRYLAL